MIILIVQLQLDVVLGIIRMKRNIFVLQQKLPLIYFLTLIAANRKV